MSTTHISDMVKKHTKRAHSADKASSFKRRDQQSNSELLADSHIPSSISNTAQTATTNQETFKAEPNNRQNKSTNISENRETTAESYSGVLNRPTTPTFQNTNEYITKTMTEKKREMRKTCFPEGGLPSMPMGSDCGSMYPAPGHNQADHYLAPDDADEFNLKQQNEELKALLSDCRTALAKVTQERERTNMADARYNSCQNNYVSPAFDALNMREGQCSQEYRPSVRKMTNYDFDKMANTRCNRGPNYLPTFRNSNTEEERHVQQAPPTNQLIHQNETMIIKNEPVRDERRIQAMPAPENINTRDSRYPGQSKFCDYREPVYNNFNDNSYINVSDNDLERKFHRFSKITNPRQTLNYFIGEFERLNVTNDRTKYNIIVGKWVPDEVSQYYGLTNPEDRNFQTFKEFCEKRDNLLTPILSKPPVHTSKTPFSVYLTEATEWAYAKEDDRVKFFLYYHAPVSLKSRIEEYFLEDLSQFKRRVQSIWSRQDDDYYARNQQVNYDRSRRNQNQRVSRRRNNGRDNFPDQNYIDDGNYDQSFDNRNQDHGNNGNYTQNSNNRNRYHGNGNNNRRNYNARNQNYGNNSNYGRNANGRDRNYNNDSGNERDYNNRRNSNDDYNDHRDVTHSNEPPSRPNNVNNYPRQGNSLPPSQ